MTRPASRRSVLFRPALARPAAVLLLLAAPAFARDGPAKTHELVPEDYFTLRTVGSVAASPDGSAVAYTLTGWEEGGEAMNTDLWVVGADGETNTRLTFDAAADGEPMWAPDGESVYFLSARSGGNAPPEDGDTQVWKVDADGKNLAAVTRVPGGVEGAELAADGSAVFYTTPREAVEDDLAGLRSQYKDLDYGHGVVKYSTLHRLDLATWRSEEVAAPDRFIRAFAVAPDGNSVALVTDPDRNLITHEGQSRVDLLDVATGEIATVTKDDWRADHPSPFGWIDAPDISEGGKLLFTVAFDGFPTLLYVAEREGEGYELSRIRSEDPVTIVDGAAEFVAGSGDVAYLGEDHGRARVYVAKGEGYAETEIVTPGDVVVSDFDLHEWGAEFYAAATPTELGDVYARGRRMDVMVFPRGVAEKAIPEDVVRSLEASNSFQWRTIGGEEFARVVVEDLPAEQLAELVPPEKLTDVNPQTADWRFPETTIYQWTGEGGAAVEGILELPPGYEKGDGPLPLVVVIHGGPTAATPYARQFRIYGRSLLAARGYAMLAPNYRGSTGYGDEFMTDLIGRENDVEVEDIVTGVEALVKEGIADPAKLGVMGWSNGGFLTNALLSETVTVRGAGGGGANYDPEVGFAAASSGAGVVDQVIQWGTEDTPGHVVNYMSGKLPWEFPAEYVESSPLYELNKTKTPTLIHVGGADARVPPEHAKTLYRALYNYLDVPAELVVYPGEPHGLMKRSNRAAKMAWDHAWFDKYLKGGGGTGVKRAGGFTPPGSGAVRYPVRGGTPDARRRRPAPARPPPARARGVAAPRFAAPGLVAGPAPAAGRGRAGRRRVPPAVLGDAGGLPGRIDRRKGVRPDARPP